jgi:hypothetical protein
MELDMILKSSPVWTMSISDLISHLGELDGPDQIYWDSRQLKKDGKKFQSLEWTNWPKPSKIDGEWKFIDRTPKISCDDSPSASVQSRIEHGSACSFIQLSDAEKSAGIYHGSGWSFAKCSKGQFAEILYVEGFAEDGEINFELIAEEVSNCLKEEDFEILFGMCSSSTFCQPRFITNRDDFDEAIEFLQMELQKEFLADLECESGG